MVVMLGEILLELDLPVGIPCSITVLALLLLLFFSFGVFGCVMMCSTCGISCGSSKFGNFGSFFAMSKGFSNILALSTSAHILRKV